MLCLAHTKRSEKVFKIMEFLISDRGGGRYEELVVLSTVLDKPKSEIVGGAIKGKFVLNWQKLVVL